MASTIDVANLLLAAGADMNARDVDHESTPAQYMVSERQDVARHLISRGCETDLLMAAAVGDVERAQGHLDADSGCIRTRVDSDWFPMAHPKAGGTIYNWTLGFHASAHEVAHKFGHNDVLDLLFERTPSGLKLVEACWLGDEARVRSLRAEAPSVADTLSDQERQLIAHAARNNRTMTVRLMLECGLPVDARSQHQATPLHWAAFHGNAEMTREILLRRPSLEALDADFKATPLGWAMHGSEHGWHQTGDYALTVDLLLRAGAPRPAAISGSAAVREVLQRS
jgi:ankyrin repeat protein